MARTTGDSQTQRNNFTDPKHVFAGILMSEKKIVLVRHEHHHDDGSVDGKKIPELTIFLTKPEAQSGKQQEVLRTAVLSKHQVQCEIERKIKHIMHSDKVSIVEASVWLLKLSKDDCNNLKQLAANGNIILLPLKQVLSDIASGDDAVTYTCNGQKLKLSGLSKRILLENRDMLK
jgi:hypothetical protein